MIFLTSILLKQINNVKQNGYQGYYKHYSIFD